MNAEILLQHFDRIAEAPDAIPRLRRFILDLAVRGKLVAQNPEDEPAVELLKRIIADKTKGLKGQQQLPDIEYELDIPLGWSLAPLISLGRWAIGAGFPKNEQGIMDAPYFFLKVSDMNLPGNEKYITTSQNSIDSAAAIRIGAKLHPPGTIIFPKIGGAIATNKRRILTKESAIDNNCLGITFNKELNREWAYLVLISIDFTQYQAGTAVPALQQSVLEKIPIGLPPLAEQHRIVAKVDELMALCDQLEAARNERETQRNRLVTASLSQLSLTQRREGAKEEENKLSAFAPLREPIFLANIARLATRPEHIKELRQTILDLAVRGRLVPQDPEDEPAEKLVQWIQKEKSRLAAEGTYKKPKLMLQVPDQEKPFSLPFNWGWFRLESLVFLLGDGLHGTPEYTQGGDYYFINGNNLVAGAIVIKPNTKTVSFEEFKKHKKPMTSNTVLVSINGTLGSVAFYNNEPIILGKSACYFNLPERVDKNFIKLLITSRYFMEYSLQKATGTTIKNLSLKAMNELLVPLPPLAEQHRIVAKVDELMALCDQLEAQLVTTETGNRRLLEAVLRDALAPAHESAAA